MECTSEQIEQLHAIIRSGTSEQRTVERARIVLACIGEQRADQVAQELGLNVSTVYKWRERFRQYGMDGLKDSHRSGRPVIYGKETGDKIFAKLEPPPPMDCRDGMELLWEKHWAYPLIHSLALYQGKQYPA